MEADVASADLAASDFSTSNPLSHVPHFGFDHFVSNFPQELGEFTAIPCFESDGTPHGGLGGDGKGQAGAAGDARWMHFMSD